MGLRPIKYDVLYGCSTIQPRLAVRITPRRGILRVYDTIRYWTWDRWMHRWEMFLLRRRCRRSGIEL